MREKIVADDRQQIECRSTDRKFLVGSLQAGGHIFEREDVTVGAGPFLAVTSKSAAIRDHLSSIGLERAIATWPVSLFVRLHLKDKNNENKMELPGLEFSKGKGYTFQPYRVRQILPHRAGAVRVTNNG